MIRLPNAELIFLVLACIDVDYRSGQAVVACLELSHWEVAEASSTHVVVVTDVEPYQPGEFYRRELPCIRAVLERVTAPLDVVVIDGYVWLGEGRARPGLGAHLYQALGATVSVVGVAKNLFRGASGAVEVIRGTSTRPLFVTAEGMTYERAAEHVASMHGEHRVPTLLRRVDRLARDWSP